jgi:hypothetical protein
MPHTSSALDFVDAVYLISIVADQPRWIDQYIDYFGGGAADNDIHGVEAGTGLTPDARP